MCVFSACKSAIVSPYIPALAVGHSEFTCVESSACVGCPHLFNLWYYTSTFTDQTKLSL